MIINGDTQMLKMYVAAMTIRSGFPEFVAGKQFQFYEVGTREQAINDCENQYQEWALRAVGHVLSGFREQLTQLIGQSVESNLVACTPDDDWLLSVTIKSGAECLKGR